MKIQPPDLDAAGNVLNGEQTYQTLAQRLRAGGSIIVAWRDRQHLYSYDILFTLPRYQYGALEEGMHAADTLFVSIMFMGAGGFKVDDVDKPPYYVADTLDLDEVSAVGVAELINGVTQQLLVVEATREWPTQ